MTSDGVRAPFGLQAIDGHIMNALNDVITSVPKWHTLLDNLNNQIASRQFELAAQDLLGPKETDDDPLLENENENVNGVENNMSHPPTLTRGTTFPSPTTLARAESNGTPPRILHHSSPPGLAPLQRHTSRRLNTPNFPPKITLPSVPRKPKKGSIASGESQAPKCRTRSMIVVYYDSAAQNAFEELVKLISASRNAMRKGKIAVRMADMKRMAELETDTDSEDEALSATISAAKIPIGNELESDEKVPKLEFISTRKMGPSRVSSAAAALRNSNNGYLTGVGQRALFPKYRGNSGHATPGPFPSIFDELDSGLEWCQSMCEYAAHQLLRDGNCNTEIAGIKKRLWEVKEIAGREIAKAAAEKKEELKKEPMAGNVDDTRRLEEPRELKLIQMRKPFTAIKSLESDQIEVGNEGCDDVLLILQWRSAA
jgi:hypothetical protein